MCLPIIVEDDGHSFVSSTVLKPSYTITHLSLTTIQWDGFHWPILQMRKLRPKTYLLEATQLWEDLGVSPEVLIPEPLHGRMVLSAGGMWGQVLLGTPQSEDWVTGVCADLQSPPLGTGSSVCATVCWGPGSGHQLTCAKPFCLAGPWCPRLQKRELDWMTRWCTQSPWGSSWDSWGPALWIDLSSIFNFKKLSAILTSIHCQHPLEVIIHLVSSLNQENNIQFTGKIIESVWWG